MYRMFIHGQGEVNMAARNELSLKHKVEVIECANKNPSQSSLKIADVLLWAYPDSKASSRKRQF